MSKIRDEVRRRIPRLTMSLVITVIFLIISFVIQQTQHLLPFSQIDVPGIGQNISSIIIIITVLIAIIFLIRALSDALFLGDILTDILVNRLGINEERSPKRAARELIYIIVIILIVTALSPILGVFVGGDVGSGIQILLTYLALGVIIVLIYDIGRTLYRVIELKVESFADKLSNIVEEKGEG
ncbi:hypothetical protein KAH85_03315 [Candidatus Bathyarchaeota archaeon]|nr:hypothetical protein [Candidatus Bathyarchaeota archaeon]